MYNRCCCCSSPVTRRIIDDINNISGKKTIYVLDNELRLRPMINQSNSSLSITNQNNIGRFDELTHFFNIINGLFYQSALTLNLSTYHLSPLFRLSNMNIGVTVNLDQQTLEQQKIDLLQNMTIYSIIGRSTENSTMNDNDKQSNSTSILKFRTSDQNFTFGLHHRWTPSLSTMLRFGTTTGSKRFWSRIEYRRPKETYEFIGEYDTEHPPNFQFNCLSCLWKRNNCQIDGGFDLRLTQKEKLADLGFRLRYSSNTIILKCDLHHPLEDYLIAFQRSITKHFLVGLLIEKIASRSIKLSLMSQWNVCNTGLRIHTLLNTQNQFGVAFVHQFNYFPLVLQIFNLYSWKTHRYQWGIGIQCLL